MEQSEQLTANILSRWGGRGGPDNGVFVDEAGNVGESSTNVAFVSEGGVLQHPKFDHILSGCTSLRLLELARGVVGRVLKGVEVRDIPVAEARAAREMLLIGSSVKVAPIVEWDRKPMGDGTGPHRHSPPRAARQRHADGQGPTDRRSVLRRGARARHEDP
jgi:4-amino-4-deoxychorismate lyase